MSSDAMTTVSTTIANATTLVAATATSTMTKTTMPLLTLLTTLLTSTDLSTTPDTTPDPASPLPDLQSLQDSVAVLQESLTAFYLIVMGAIIWAMQIGFAFLEAGTMREKNAINSLTRMFMNGWIAAIMWWLVGYAFAFGTGNGFIGFNPTGKWALGTEPGTDLALWYFEYVFCAASSAIISGSVAEHVTHHGFILYCMFFTGWIYPVGAHWEWGADGWLLLGQKYPTTADNPVAIAETNGNETNYYYVANYQDFAGSGVVHIMGAFAGLAAMLTIGPRRELKRSFKEPPAEKPTPHSIPLTTLGTMLLTFGFVAFNGGSQLALHRQGDAGAMSTAVCNTTISGAGGALSAILWHKVFGYFRICDRHSDRESDPEGKWSLVVAINGSLAGMVAVCAGCNVYYPWASFVVGVIAGLTFIFWMQIITKLRIDDPMDTFAVHGGAGIWGALAVALLKRTGGIVIIVTDETGTHGNFTAEGWMYFAWQIVGIVTIAGWAYLNMGAFMLVLRGVDKLLRVSNTGFRLLRPCGEDQRRGMDVVENEEKAYSYDNLGYTASTINVSSDPLSGRRESESSLSASRSIA